VNHFARSCANRNWIDHMPVGLVHGEDLTRRIIGLAMRVHRRLGPGLLESAYHQCLCYELSQAGLAFEQRVSLPIRYDGVEIESGYRADIVVCGAKSSWSSSV
jgi:hypothetical protein